MRIYSLNVTTDTSQLLMPGEVARLLGVNPKTVARWAKSGQLPCIRTLGGHRRFPAKAIYELIDQKRDH